MEKGVKSEARYHGWDNLRMTEKRRLEIAAPAIRRRTITRNKVLVLLVLIPARGSCDFTVMVAARLVMKSLRLMQLDGNPDWLSPPQSQRTAWSLCHWGRCAQQGGRVDTSFHSNARRREAALWFLGPAFFRLFQLNKVERKRYGAPASN